MKHNNDQLCAWAGLGKAVSFSKGII